jgi:PAS domain S-box-containing protein
VLALAGLFGGGISSVFSIIIAGSFRVYIGGPGVWAGLATIVLCTIVGLFFRKIYQNKPEDINFFTLLLIGFPVHLIMLSCQLLFPWPDGIDVIRLIGIPVMAVFPVAFLLMSMLLGSQEKRFQGLLDLKKAEALYRTTLYSIGDAVITTNKSGHIQQLNRLAEKLTGLEESKAQGKHLDEVIRVIDESTNITEESLVKQVQRSKSVIELSGKILISNDVLEIPVSISGSPLKDENGHISGVVLVFHDRTDERARQLLLESNEARYRELVESTDAISWEYDIVQDNWNYIAPQVEQKLGWAPEEWTGIAFWKKNLHPDDRKWAEDHYKTMTTKGYQYVLEYRFLDKTEKYIWIRDVISVEMSNNKAVKLRGIMLDITSRKKMELDLKEKNNFIQTVLDYLPIGVALNNIVAKKILYLNRRLEEIYGWDASELKKPEIFEKIFPDADYRKEILKSINSDANPDKSGLKHWENISITRSDGSIAVINMVNIPITEQNIMVSVVMDVTVQTLAEKALKESEEHFRKLFENHTAVHLLIELKTGKIVNANQAAANFYGYPVDELRGMQIDHINTLPAEIIYEAIKDARKRNKMYFEFRHRLASGLIRDVEVFSSVVELRGKEYIYSIVHDITDKKELLNEIIQAKTKAEENDRLKTAFLANMSHEIRTPLNGILGFTDLLTSNENLTPAKKEKYSKIIHKSAESLMQIINDILDISKLETGQMNISRKKFIVNDTLYSLQTLYNQKLIESNKSALKLVLQLSDSKIALYTDENRLTQIFTNLLDNAMKFTREGAITFGISGVTDSEIAFFVSDTGIGIIKEKQSIIFDRFAQAGEEISLNYGGNGLGLSIVKKLIGLMGGKIYVESEPGEGTTFSFYLPISGTETGM